MIAAGAFAAGYLAHRNQWIPQSIRDAVRGQNVSTTTRPFGGDAFPLQERGMTSEEQDAILALGYAQGSQPLPASSGVKVFDPGLAYNGLNLYTSGHAPEAILMDMQGKTLHSWKCDFATALPRIPRPAHVREAATKSWRRAYLYPNGDLLAIFEGVALVKLDKTSTPLWTYMRGCHHDLSVMPNGDIHVLTSELRDGIIDNGIARLNANGEEQAYVSLLDAFRGSRYATLLDWLPKQGDVLHVNTLNVLDGTHANANPAFRAGNILLSSLTLNTIAVINMDTRIIDWAATGLWRAQHDPELLANGAMLVFDNRGAGTTSRVLEIDPQTQQILWQYPNDGVEAFYSEWCGAAARLPNGNTLISETDNGRALEVTAGHQIVWEFINPHQFEENGVQMVAALFEVVRLPADYAASWLAAR